MQQPVNGEALSVSNLVPIRTKLEVEKRNQLVYIWICEIPSKYTREILRLREGISGQGNPPLLHLRRVAKAPTYPRSLRSWLGSEIVREFCYIFLCIDGLVDRQELLAQLSRTQAFSKHVPEILCIPAPLNAPISPEHAAELSHQYWPTVYTSTNPFGPHPGVLTRQTQAMEKNDNAKKWMDLAFDVAYEPRNRDRGYDIGTVFVERDKASGIERIVCAASDARYANNHLNGGDPARHSVMRAIEMVAEKRRVLAGRLSPDGKDDPDAKKFQSEMTAMEKNFFAEADTLTPNGYVCLDLLVFTTHEPCLMCSMALVHSRVGGLVFAKGMMQTGGMLVERPNPPISEDDMLWNMGVSSSSVANSPFKQECGLQYGLFWRADLNWRFLAWQWAGGNGPCAQAKDLPQDVHA